MFVTAEKWNEAKRLKTTKRLHLNQVSTMEHYIGIKIMILNTAASVMLSDNDQKKKLC